MHCLTVDQDQRRIIRPLAVMMKNGVWFLNCVDEEAKSYSVIRIQINKITHFNNKEIFGIDLVRPLSDKAYPFDKQILRIHLDFQDTVLEMEIVEPISRESSEQESRSN